MKPEKNTNVQQAKADYIFFQKFKTIKCLLEIQYTVIVDEYIKLTLQNSFEYNKKLLKQI